MKCSSAPSVHHFMSLSTFYYLCNFLLCTALCLSRITYFMVNADFHFASVRKLITLCKYILHFYVLPSSLRTTVYSNAMLPSVPVSDSKFQQYNFLCVATPPYQDFTVHLPCSTPGKFTYNLSFQSSKPQYEAYRVLRNFSKLKGSTEMNQYNNQNKGKSGTKILLEILEQEVYTFFKKKTTLILS
jgi:hypothetical protein